MGLDESAWLYRYTSLPSALEIVRNRTLTLLSPKTWPDGNDTGYLNAYMRAKSLNTLVALCFTSAFETSQHWTLFAPGMAGVRLKFSRAALERDVAAVPGAQLRNVVYRKVEDADLNAADIQLWPFIKRIPYEGEDEVRLIYESSLRVKQTLGIPISGDTLKQVTFSPQLPRSLTSVMKSTLLEASAFPKLSVTRSTLLGNNRWLKPVEDKAESMAKLRMKKQVAAAIKSANERIAQRRAEREE